MILPESRNLEPCPRGLDVDGRKESTRFQYGFSDLFGKTEKSAYLCANKKRPAQHEVLSSYLRG